MCSCGLFVLDCVMLYEVYVIVLWCWCVLCLIRCVVLRGVRCVFCIRMLRMFFEVFVFLVCVVLVDVV